MTGVCLVDGQDDRSLFSGLGKMTGVCLVDGQDDRCLFSGWAR